MNRLYICEMGCVWICLMPTFNCHSFVKISMFGCFRQYLAKIDVSPLRKMSTSRFGLCQHWDLDKVDIFLWNSACSYSMAVPHTPDWLLFDDTGTYDAVICAKWNCNLECINKVIRYWIKSCISFWRRMEEIIAQERVTFQYKITSAGTEGSEQ